MSNTNGAIIGSSDFVAEQECVVLKKKNKMDAAAAKVSGFWANHRADIIAAEQQLVSQGGLVNDKFTVKALRALIVSRTGHGAKAKNNKDKALLKEALAACVANPASRCPPVASHDETVVNGDADGVQGDGASDVDGDSANSVNGDGVHSDGDGDSEGEDEDGEMEVDE